MNDVKTIKELRGRLPHDEWMNLGRHVWIQWLTEQNLLVQWMKDLEEYGRDEGMEENLPRQNIRARDLDMGWIVIPEYNKACVAYGSAHFDTDYNALTHQWHRMCTEIGA